MKSILMTMTMIVMVGTNAALACTVAPVSRTAQVNDLTSRALTDLKVSVENLQKVEVEDYKGSYIWTPMCPKGLNSSATLTVSFVDNSGTFPTSCTAVVKISKNLIYKERFPKMDFDYIQEAICLE